MRLAFAMALHPGREDEYRRRHSPIWPELEEELRRAGVHTYSIFLEPATHQLFAYVEVDDPARWSALADSEVCRRWWTSMRLLMPTNSDDSPVTTGLVEVFHLG